MKAWARIFRKWRANKLLIIIKCTCMPSDWIFFQMLEHRWKKRPLLSVFGNVAEAELIAGKFKVEKNFIWFVASSSHVVSYLQKESVVCCPCFAWQQAKITGYCYVVVSTILDINYCKIAKMRNLAKKCFSANVPKVLFFGLLVRTGTISDFSC